MRWKSANSRRSAKKSPSKFERRGNGWGGERLEDRRLLAFDFTRIASGVDNKLAELTGAIADLAKPSTATLPILGDSLNGLLNRADGPKTPIQRAIDTARTGLSSALSSIDPNASANDIKSALLASGFTRDTNGDGLDANDIKISKFDRANGALTFTARVGSSTTIASRSFNFDLGLPGVPFQISSGGKLDVAVDVDYSKLTIRCEGTQVYLESPAKSLLTTSVHAVVKEATLRGTMGFFQVVATPVAGAPSIDLNAKLLMDASGLTLSNARLSGAANVNLILAVGVGSGMLPSPSLPQITTRFVMNWDLGGASNATAESLGSAPSVQFNDVKLGLGTFLSNQVRPILESIRKVTLPLSPVHDLLKLPLPGLTDLTEAAGLGEVTLEKLAELAVASHVLPPDYQLLADIAINVHKLAVIVNSAQFSGANDVLLPVGSFDLSDSGNLRGSKLANGYNSMKDLIQAVQGAGTLPIENLTAFVPHITKAVATIEDQIKNGLPNDLPPIARERIDSAFAQIDNTLRKLENGVGIKFPLLQDPRGGVFKLLLGQDADFVRFDAVFHGDAKETRALPIWGPIEGRFDGQVNIDLELHAGYDTYGLRKFFESVLERKPDAKFLDDGFYFETAKDLARLTSGLSVQAGAPLRFGVGIVAEAYPHLSGSLRVHGTDVEPDRGFYVAFADPGVNGRLRVFDGASRPAIFQVGGGVTADFGFKIEASLVVKEPITGSEIVLARKVVYDLPLAQKKLIDFQDVDASNPFRQNTPLPKSLDVVFDANFEEGGNDGLEDTIIAQVRTNAQSGEKFLVIGLDSNIRDANIYPLDSVKSLKIIGSDDDEAIVIDGSILGSIQVVGGGGRDLLDFFDHGFDHVKANYVVSDSALWRYVPSALAIYPYAFETKIVYDKVESVSLDTSNAVHGVVSVASLAAPTVISSGAAGADFTLGFGDRKLKYLDNLKLLGGSGPDNLLIEDRASDRHMTYRLNEHGLRRISRVWFPSPYSEIGHESFQDAVQNLEFADIDFVRINGADAGNSFVVGLVPHQQSFAPTPMGVVFNTGKGDDDVSILATTGQVTINGQGGNDFVTVGSPEVGTKFVRDGVDIGNVGGLTRLTVDDQAGTETRTPIMSVYRGVGAIQGFTPKVGGLFPAATSINYRVSETEQVDVLAGSGGNSFHVIDTANNVVWPIGGSIPRHSMTRIQAGSGLDSIYVLGTTGPLTLDGQPLSGVVIGGDQGQAGNLNRITGQIKLRGAMASVTIVDGSRTLPYTYMMESAEFYRIDSAGARTASIFYSEASVNYLGATLGNGGNTLFVNGTLTPSGGFGSGIGLFTGRKADAVLVRGASGPLSIDLGPGAGQSVVIGDRDHSLDAIHGVISVIGDTPYWTNVSNEASTVIQQATIDGGVDLTGTFQSATRLQFNVDHYDTLNRIFFTTRKGEGTLSYDTGRGGDTVSVVGVPPKARVSVYGNREATDVFAVYYDDDRVKGAIDFRGQHANGDYGIYSDFAGPAGRAYTISRPLPDEARIDRAGVQPVIFGDLSEVVVYAPQAGNTQVNTRATPAQTYFNMLVGDGSRVKLGSLAPQIGGVLANIGGWVAVGSYARTDAVTLTLDDSGNSGGGDPTPRSVTLRTDDAASDFNSISGFAPGLVQWHGLGANSKIELLGGAADETFVIENSTFAPAIRVDGGGGVNTLDYSSEVHALAAAGKSNNSPGVSVNLQRGAATGLTGGISRLQHVIGSVGNDILVGDGGDVLEGGDGRDLLIAGAALSDLFGGEGDDVLIAATTVIDRDQAALDAVMAEWASADKYSARVLSAQSKLTGVKSNGGGATVRGQKQRDLFLVSPQDQFDSDDTERVVLI